MKKRTIGKCRFYCDISSYLKHLGYYSGSEYVTKTRDGIFDYGEHPNMFGLNPLYEIPKAGWGVGDGGWDVGNFDSSAMFQFNINPEYEHESYDNFFGS